MPAAYFNTAYSSHDAAVIKILLVSCKLIIFSENIQYFETGATAASSIVCIPLNKGANEQAILTPRHHYSFLLT